MAKQNNKKPPVKSGSASGQSAAQGRREAKKFKPEYIIYGLLGVLVAAIVVLIVVVFVSASASSGGGSTYIPPCCQ